MSDLVFDPIIAPPYITALGLLMLAATLYVYLVVGSRLRRWENLLLLTLRLVAIAGVLLLLTQPSRRLEIPERKLSEVMLVGLDSSSSMAQRDAGGLSRLDSARQTLRDSRLIETGGHTKRLFQFDAEATPVFPEVLQDVKPTGTSTRIHRSVETMLGSLSPQERGSALVLFTDGHDFELVNPGKTAALARARRIPIYAVPLGEQGLVRDASVNIVNFEPYSYAKQKARISASVRLIGCEHERISVQLLRGDKVVQNIKADTGEKREVPVDFEVTEPDAGQYEYEVRLLPLNKEADTKNNSAITFLNVIDQRIRVLLLEGAPYWDTSFLRRSLASNDKIELEAILQYTKDKARRSRNVAKGSGDQEAAVPTTQAQFNAYDLIILGKSVDPFFDRERFAMLTAYVKEHGGTVILSRGQAFTGELGKDNELDPMQWADRASDKVQLKVGREGQTLSPFRVLTENTGGVEGLPALLGARQMGDRKALSAMLAQAHDSDNNTESPAMVHRRVGRGQVLSVAVEGLWRWSFNPKAPATNSVFDRFWDQLVLWLVASGDTTPNQPFTLRSHTANLILGAKMHIRLNARDAETVPKEVPLTIYSEDRIVSRTVLTPEDAKTHLRTEYLPEKVGRYRAAATLPDGKTQEVKWMVFDDNPEEKEVAADVSYLKALCEASGGQLLLPGELAKLSATLQTRLEADLQKVRLMSIWDQPWIFYTICAAFGLDWYLRRKWGLS